MASFKIYYQLTKPGIVYGNLVTAGGGYLLAAKTHIDLKVLLSLLAGTALIIASACVLNNYIDRDIDAKMTRTRHRALVSGSVSGSAAVTYAVLLGLAGFWILKSTNGLTVLVGAIGMLFYVLIYGIAKRRSVHGTIIGSVAGAMPPVAGYTAAAGRLDSGALLLFIILVCWQMPHFYAIAMYRLADYKAAGLPVLPVKKGLHATKIQIILYVIAFMSATLFLTLLGYTGVIFLLVVGVIGVVWLRRGLKGLDQNNDDRLWARKMFLFSLVVICVLSVMLPIGALLP